MLFKHVKFALSRTLYFKLPQFFPAKALFYHRTLTGGQVKSEETIQLHGLDLSKMIILNQPVRYVQKFPYHLASNYVIRHSKTSK